MKQHNGGLLGPYNTTTAAAASGSWNLNDIRQLGAAGIFPWNNSTPYYQLNFNTVTTLPSGITFTRASAGRYFNSSGTLATASTDAARFDFNSSTLVNQGLLIEESRTNLCNYSEQFNSTNFRTSGTITANAAVAPDGATTAESWTGTNEGFDIYPNDYGNNPGVTQTFSFFVKPNGASEMRITMGGATSYLNFSTGAVSGAGVNVATQLANGWWRFSSTRTKDNQYWYWGGNFLGSGVYIWGIQLENGSSPSSYIPTTSANVTRAADVATMTGTNFSSWFNASEGTILAQYDLNGVQNNQTILSIDNNSANNSIKVIGVNGSAVGGYFEVTNGGTLQAGPLPASGSPATATTYKVAGSYKANSFAGSRNGGTVALDASGTVPTVDRMRIGWDFSGATMVGHVQKINYWNVQLPNDRLPVITT